MVTARVQVSQSAGSSQILSQSNLPAPSTSPRFLYPQGHVALRIEPMSDESFRREGQRRLRAAWARSGVHSVETACAKWEDGCWGGFFRPQGRQLFGVRLYTLTFYLVLPGATSFEGSDGCCALAFRRVEVSRVPEPRWLQLPGRVPFAAVPLFQFSFARGDEMNRPGFSADCFS